MTRQTDNFLKFLLEDEDAFEKRFLTNLSPDQRKEFEKEISKEIKED